MSDKGAPEWIVTFSDIVSLLVTFFILLLTWSTLETEKFEMIMGSLRGGLGIMGSTSDLSSLSPHDALRNQRHDDQGTDEPSDEKLVNNPFKDEAVRLKQSFGEDIDFDKVRNGYRIRITARTMFEPGSAELTPGCRRGLMDVAKIVATRYNAIRVDGHADASFRPSARYPDAWSLSVARATAAARELVERGGVGSERMSVAGYGSRRPAYKGRSAEAQVRNRRIEIVILKTPSRRKRPTPSS